MEGTKSQKVMTIRDMCLRVLNLRRTSFNEYVSHLPDGKKLGI